MGIRYRDASVRPAVSICHTVAAYSFFLYRVGNLFSIRVLVKPFKRCRPVVGFIQLHRLSGLTAVSLQLHSHFVRPDPVLVIAVIPGFLHRYICHLLKVNFQNGTAISCYYTRIYTQFISTIFYIILSLGFFIIVCNSYRITCGSITSNRIIFIRYTGIRSIILLIIILNCILCILCRFPYCI